MLKRFKTAMKEREDGFTLIELLVVMIIIGILAAIAIPVFLNQRNSGYDAATKSDVKNASTAEETVYTDTQAYTAAVTGPAPSLEAVGFKISGHDQAAFFTATPDPNGKSYVIRAKSDSNKEFCYNSAESNLGVHTPASATVC